MILSNMKEDGKPIGLQDAGQSWHTDMSYSRMIAFANVLHGIKIPYRNGVPLGSTEFCSMHAAYDDLPAEMKARLGWGELADRDRDRRPGAAGRLHAPVRVPVAQRERPPAAERQVPRLKSFLQIRLGAVLPLLLVTSLDTPFDSLKALQRWERVIKAAGVKSE